MGEVKPISGQARTTEVTRTLFVRFSFDEVEDRQAALLEEHRLLSEAVDEAERVKLLAKDARNRVDVHSSAAESIARDLRGGGELREVKCVKTVDLGEDRVFIVRPDTGEVVEERGLRPEERQGSLL